MSKFMTRSLVLIGFLSCLGLGFIVGERTGQEYGYELGRYKMIEDCNRWVQKTAERCEE